jgi:hypothetical protein
MLEAIHTYVFVGLIEQYGVYESSLIFTGLAYLTGYPFFLALKGIFPTKKRLFMALYCLAATSTGSLPFWASSGLGYSYPWISTIPFILLPFGVFFLFTSLDKIGFFNSAGHSPSDGCLAVFLIALFALPIATVADWVFFNGENICAKTADYSILLIAFGLPAIGASVFILLLLPVVGLVSLMSATVRWLTRERPPQPESP